MIMTIMEAETTIMVVKEEIEEDFKEEMEEEVKEEMVVEDQETVEDKEAMDPKIANILNVTKTILREALEEV